MSNSNANNSGSATTIIGTNSNNTRVFAMAINDGFYEFGKGFVTNGNSTLEKIVKPNWVNLIDLKDNPLNSEMVITTMKNLHTNEEIAILVNKEDYQNDNFGFMLTKSTDCINGVELKDFINCVELKEYKNLTYFGFESVTLFEKTELIIKHRPNTKQPFIKLKIMEISDGEKTGLILLIEIDANKVAARPIHQHEQPFSKDEEIKLVLRNIALQTSFQQNMLSLKMFNFPSITRLDKNNLAICRKVNTRAFNLLRKQLSYSLFKKQGKLEYNALYNLLQKQLM